MTLRELAGLIVACLLAFLAGGFITLAIQEIAKI